MRHRYDRLSRVLDAAIEALRIIREVRERRQARREEREELRGPDTERLDDEGQLVHPHAARGVVIGDGWPRAR